MTQTIFGGLVVALILGIAALAKSDNDYYRDSTMVPLTIFVWVVFLPLLSWTAAIYFAYDSMKDYVDVSKGKQALDTLNSYRVPFRYLFGIPPGLTLFLLGFGFFFKKLEDHREKRKNKEAVDLMKIELEKGRANQENAKISGGL